MTGGLRKPAGRQCGFRHHLALSSIVRLFHSVKVEFCGLMPLAYFLRRARTGSRPPPVAALALALTLPGNGGSPARRTGHPRRARRGPKSPQPGARDPARRRDPHARVERARGGDPRPPRSSPQQPPGAQKAQGEGPRTSPPGGPAKRRSGGRERGGSRDHRHPPGGARSDRARGAATSPAAPRADGKGARRPPQPAQKRRGRHRPPRHRRGANSNGAAFLFGWEGMHRAGGTSHRARARGAARVGRGAPGGSSPTVEGRIYQLTALLKCSFDNHSKTVRRYHLALSSPLAERGGGVWWSFS